MICVLSPRRGERYPAKLRTARCVVLSLLSYILNLGSLICLAIQNAQIDGKLDRKPTSGHCVGRDISGTREVFTPPFGEFEHIKRTLHKSRVYSYSLFFD